MPQRPDIYKTNVVIDCAAGQAGQMADFYSKLLGGDITHPHTGEWAAITGPAGQVYAFQEVPFYTPPAWPWQQGQQAQMIHFDYYVEDLDSAVAYALEIGARLAPQQYFKSSRTMLDPAGHTFCLDTDQPED